MKKTLLLALCATMIFSIALYGCNKENTDGDNTDETVTQTPETTVPETDETEATRPETTAPENGDTETEEPGTVTPATDLNGSLEEIYEGIEANSAIDFGMTFRESFQGDMASSYTGLTAEELEQYVEDTLAVSAMISTNAHLVVLLRCTDDAAALEVKTLIAEGFDSGRWICVFPEKSVVVEAGSYVLLISSREENVDALINGFAALAGNDMGEPDVFYTGM